MESEGTAVETRDTHRSGAEVSRPEELDWLVVGGGIHGVHLSARLLGEADVSPDRLLIVDPADQLLARWHRCTTTTGMAYLRSPAVHHLGLSPWSLQRFAGKPRNRTPGLFAGTYQRPSLELFNAHCRKVIETSGLAERHAVARVVSCTPERKGVRVRLSDDRELFTGRLLLALGSQQLSWPDWAPRDHPRVHHIFQEDFDGCLPSPQTVAVLGGGISAVQLALRLAGEGHWVHLVSRHDLRAHQFDSDPGWLGPKRMSGFLRERDLDRRRKMIQDARHRGSVPPLLRTRVRGAIERQELAWHRVSVEGVRTETDSVCLELSDGDELQVDRLLLATGMSPERPGGRLVDELITKAELPVARCGFPIVDRALRWHPRIHVSGGLAELELGPAARNIAGARRAGQRLIRWHEQQHSAPRRRTARAATASEARRATGA